MSQVRSWVLRWPSAVPIWRRRSLPGSVGRLAVSRRGPAALVVGECAGVYFTGEVGHYDHASHVVPDPSRLCQGSLGWSLL